MSGSSQVPKQDIVCILGMGRSGTSLVTRISNLAGLYLGPEQSLFAPNDGNPKGYWENSKIVDLNDAILASHGGSWDEPPLFPNGWESASSLDELKQLARTVVKDSYGSTQLWGWKDPRNCLTLPFWKQLLPEMRFIVCLRNPVDVAHSLERLYNFSPEKSSNLWLSYVSSALMHTDGKPRLKIFYEDLMIDWLAELRRVADFLGNQEWAERADVQNAVKEFIQDELRRYRTPLAEMAVDSGIAHGARALYVAERISRRFARKDINAQKQSDKQIDKAMALATSLEFTGERYVPTETGQIKYEHLHRYALSLEFAAGKSVLDIASGEGYGAALLAQVAKTVTGVDIDLEIVNYSRDKYQFPNLNFLVGGCHSIPLPDASVDLVTSFETIEHHDQHEDMMLEFKRVLKPNGNLIISSPNRLTYSDESQFSNPFHVRELYYEEFHQLLGKHFKHVQVYGQRLATGSFVTPLQKSSAKSLKAYTGDAARLRQDIESLPSPIFFIAVCSDRPLIKQETINSIYLDVNDDLFKSSETEKVVLIKQRETARHKEMRAQLLASQDQLRQAVRVLAEDRVRVQRKKELLDCINRSPSWGLTVRPWGLWKQSWRILQAQTGRNLHGILEMPAENLNVSDYLDISGWAYSSEVPISHVGAFLDNVPLGLVKHGEPRPDVVSDSGSQAPTDCGFSGKFSLDEFSVGRRTLLVRVIDERGNIKDFWRTIVINGPAKDAIASVPTLTAGAAIDTNGPSSLRAFPDHVPVGRIVGVTEINWDTGNGSEGELYVSLNGEPETLFATGPRGSKQATWIIAGSTYEFRLYAGTGHDRLLNEVSVKGTKISFRENRDHFREIAVLSATKQALVWQAQISLDSFLATNSTIVFSSPEPPEVSIILVLYNRAELTLQCFYSILRSDFDSYEVVIVDNASTDETSRLLRRIRGARIIRNETNLHFVRACNQAVKGARGRNLLFLNNDAQLVTGSLSSALRTLNSSDDIGAVGGKIILPDGTLQEAGSIIWRDGSCLGYGRGDSPFAPAYMHKRDVDYCSAAFLLTKRDLFLEDAGFDEDYSPAYYEETDYCVRLWKKGKRVVFDPNAIVFHYEFASANSQGSAIDLQIEHREIFAGKHKDWLQSQRSAAEDILAARSREKKGQRRILFIDDRVPHLTEGAGFPRCNRILTELVDLGHTVTLYPTTSSREDWGDVYQDIPSEVEVMLDHGPERLREFMTIRRDYYDVILISRPHNMSFFNSALAEDPNLSGRAKIVYDAEAVFAHREIKQKLLEGERLSTAEQEKLIEDEVRLAEDCDCVVSVSDRESNEFSKFGCNQVYTLGYTVHVAPTEKVFEARKDILFVGPIHSINTPNADSMIWFSEDILPLIQQSLGKEVRLVIAGMTCPEFRARLNNGSVEQLGKVDDLRPVYNRARLFVAPTRFSAGIPLKICEAAAHGLPTVATSLSGRQLGWDHERELLLADDPQSFAEACVRLYTNGALWNRLRDNMVKRVSQEFSHEAFSKQVRQIIE